ncbi:hypothetical protein T4A_5718 [Trichinella pseudospiralis]|uniref:Uncharacterized protein n=1 Tax=Trichinella pseudospiralis TaxID=6337 RepID=A0A0V1DTI9_TRIPS|nr:hypothetical protein T4A_5718 [Trichinella pseudospiralis]
MCQKKTPAMKQHHRSENEVTLAAPVNPGGRKALKKSGRSGSRLPTEDTDEGCHEEYGVSTSENLGGMAT